MNTEQLWNALTLNPVTNNNFDGIFSIDTLKVSRDNTKHGVVVIRESLF